MKGKTGQWLEERERESYDERREAERVKKSREKSREENRIKKNRREKKASEAETRQLTDAERRTRE